jgi:hypothetical protein
VEYRFAPDLRKALSHILIMTGSALTRLNGAIVADAIQHQIHYREQAHRMLAEKAVEPPLLDEMERSRLDRAEAVSRMRRPSSAKRYRRRFPALHSLDKPMQVVVPSVSLAATLQGAVFTGLR